MLFRSAGPMNGRLGSVIVLRTLGAFLSWICPDLSFRLNAAACAGVARRPCLRDFVRTMPRERAAELLDVRDCVRPLVAAESHRPDHDRTCAVLVREPEQISQQRPARVVLVRAGRRADGARLLPVSHRPLGGLANLAAEPSKALGRGLADAFHDRRAVKEHRLHLERDHGLGDLEPLAARRRPAPA
jgi:hypothetical protein